MSEKTNAAAEAAESDNIMQHIQDMIGDLLTNTVEKMQKKDIDNKIGTSSLDIGEEKESTVQMDTYEIRNFIGVMQKFIDNVNMVVTQIESGSSDPAATDDKFIEGYMATADNVLELAAFSMKDNLTGLSNRYGFDNRLILEWNRAARDKTMLGLVIFGVDGFAECEDRNKRDKTLKSISVTLDKSIKRSTDFIARWSENEFAALLPTTDIGGVTIVAERILQELGKLNIPCILEKNDGSTISIGVCVYLPKPTDDASEFISKAHNAYMQANEADGDKIVYV